MRLVWKTIDSPPRNWRAIAKALILLDHLVKNGAEKVVADAQQHIHDITYLNDFRYIEGNLDRGSGGESWVESRHVRRWCWWCWWYLRYCCGGRLCFVGGYRHAVRCSAFRAAVHAITCIAAAFFVVAPRETLEAQDHLPPIICAECVVFHSLLPFCCSSCRIRPKPCCFQL